MPKTQKISSFTLYITRYSVSLSAVLFRTRLLQYQHVTIGRAGFG